MIQGKTAWLDGASCIKHPMNFPLSDLELVLHVAAFWGAVLFFYFELCIARPVLVPRRCFAWVGVVRRVNGRSCVGVWSV